MKMYFFAGAGAFAAAGLFSSWGFVPAYGEGVVQSIGSPAWKPNVDTASIKPPLTAVDAIAAATTPKLALETHSFANAIQRKYASPRSWATSVSNQIARPIVPVFDGRGKANAEMVATSTVESISGSSTPQRLIIQDLLALQPLDLIATNPVLETADLSSLIAPTVSAVGPAPAFGGYDVSPLPSFSGENASVDGFDNPHAITPSLARSNNIARNEGPPLEPLSRATQQSATAEFTQIAASLALGGADKSPSPALDVQSAPLAQSEATIERGVYAGGSVTASQETVATEALRNFEEVTHDRHTARHPESEAGIVPNFSLVSASSVSTDTLSRDRLSPMPGSNFNVQAVVGKKPLGVIQLSIMDKENISLRLQDALKLLSPMMKQEMYEHFINSEASKSIITLNDLRSAGISVEFDNDDRLRFGIE